MIATLLLALSLQLPASPDLPAAIVNVPRLVAESAAGKAATAQLRAFQAEKRKVLADKQSALETLAASKAVTVQIEKARLELQRLTQDAEAELVALDRQLRDDFSKKLRPVVAKIVADDHLGIIFEYPGAMVAWAAPSVDITTKVIERLDSEAKEKK
jgi:Skp family chaperone for outer membrane proteins